MNADDDFDAFLRAALRQPAPSAIPADARAEEIANAASVALDDLAWGEDAPTEGTHDGRPDADGADGSADDDGRNRTDPPDVWDDDGADADGADADDFWSPSDADDPLLGGEPSDPHPDDGVVASDWHDVGPHLPGDHREVHDPFGHPHAGHDHDMDGE